VKRDHNIRKSARSAGKSVRTSGVLSDSRIKIQDSSLKRRFRFKHRDTEDTKKKEKALCVFSPSVLSVPPCLHKNDSRFKIQDLPAENSRVPVESSRVPVESCRVPVESSRVPVESCRVPVESSRVPVESSRVPVESCRVPVESLRVPVESCRVPVESCRVPVESCRVPGKS
jgi:hypothetical protein